MYVNVSVCTRFRKKYINSDDPNTRLGHQNKCNITRKTISSVSHSLMAVPFEFMPSPFSYDLVRCYKRTTLQQWHKSSTERVQKAEEALMEHEPAHLFGHGVLVAVSWSTCTTASVFLSIRPTRSSNNSLRTRLLR